ncbi:hypothetical protein UFOVP1336_10 [uncultured Caudovirales phage]|uniref:Uncharacterized protein n=1 Tax=uncultured Caudovirales phage TaxID=2100421 RepID=A0A6J5S292_9CAUD|nr:hypothetical protein UFOVP1336_10 [uncultured Caudovirales phage]
MAEEKMLSIWHSDEGHGYLVWKHTFPCDACGTEGAETLYKTIALTNCDDQPKKYFNGWLCESCYNAINCGCQICMVESFDQLKIKEIINEQAI